MSDAELSSFTLTLGDFDRDGHVDIGGLRQVRPTAQTQLALLLGQGDGTFRDVPQPWSVRGETLSVASGDLDGDGVLDLVVASSDEEPQ